ncbi:damage-control phosphatase ARMT1-like isoform X2 [Prorops nasuta]
MTRQIMKQKSSSVDIRDLQDIPTPVGERLSGIYKKSFAYVTIKDRLPIILTKVIDTLSRNKESIVATYGLDAANEIKDVIGAISKLKNEIATNKNIEPLQVSVDVPNDDVEVWNSYLLERVKIEGGSPTWFNTIWLYCECYMYRRLAQLFLLTKTLKQYDPFEEQKKDGFTNSLDSITSLTKYVMNTLNSDELSEANMKDTFIKLVKLNLWGNKCDLSLSAGAASNQTGDPVDLLKSLDKDILVDNTVYGWKCLTKEVTADNNFIDIVLDNAGYELFTDFSLAAFIIKHNLADKVRFYVKKYPWYVSDATKSDIHWTIDALCTSDVPELQSFGNLIKDYVRDNKWTIEEELYWTEPYDFSEMKEKDKVLYAKLSDAKLVIFKGDLNYRKLLSDINWEYTTPFIQALRDFNPTNILSLRTIKSDVVAGLRPRLAEEISAKDENWLVTGQYGLIEFNTNESCQC